MIETRHLKVGLFNAGSLNTGHEEFIVAMEELMPDIMAINETWLRAGEDEKAPMVAGFRLRHSPRPDAVRGGRGGGLGFYIRKGISARVCPHPPTSTVEQMWLRLGVGGVELIIGTAYRPPWQDVNLFLDALTESIVSFAKCDKLIIMGDLNIDLLNPSSNKAKLFEEFLQCLNLKQVVSEPTHFTEYSQTLIDIACTDAHVRKVTVKYTPDLGGHAMLLVELNIRKVKPLPRLIIYRPLKSIQLEQFNDDLNLVPWNFSETDTDTNSQVTTFTYFVRTLFDLHAPLKSGNFKDPPHPWITDTVKKMIRIRDEYHKKHKVLQTMVSKKCYKDMKHIVIAAIEREKKSYFTQHINNHIKDTKRLWKNLKNTILPNKKQAAELPSQFDNPDLVNSHFLSVPGIDKVSISQLTFYEHHRFGSESFSLNPVSRDTVLAIIRGLKSNALGIDGISLDMLLMTLPQSLDAITAIVNSSISNGVFPDSWKVAIVRPIPKNSNPSTMQDLRPISILPCVSKVLEKVVCMQLVKYLEDNSIIPQAQSGFRKGHSTATALLDVVDNMLEAQDNGMVSLLVLLDFSRAFDAINISLLLAKLAFYGFDTRAINWFHSYLDRRHQFVALTMPDGSTLTSSLQPVPRGVPQGSVLGPILFVLYSADITREITYCKHHQYADDLQLYLSFPLSTMADAVNKVNLDLEHISDWSKANSLVINPKKSKFMVVGSRKNTHNIMSGTHPQISSPMSIIVDGETVECVTEAKNLGLIMDSHLRFEKHVAKSVHNCFYRLKLLYKIRPYISEEVRVMLCESLVLSRLNYCDTVYGPCLLGRTEKLIQRVQNACGRFCFHVPPRSHMTPFLNCSNLLKMTARRKLHLSVLLFGVIDKKSPRYLFDKLVWAQSQANLHRRACTFVLVTPNHRSMAFRGSFRFAASRCWNDLPPPFRVLKTVQTFRITLKKYLLGLQKSTKT